jgi:hypothetical protein
LQNSGGTNAGGDLIQAPTHQPATGIRHKLEYEDYNGLITGFASGKSVAGGGNGDTSPLIE